MGPTSLAPPDGQGARTGVFSARRDLVGTVVRIVAIEEGEKYRIVDVKMMDKQVIGSLEFRL